MIILQNGGDLPRPWQTKAVSTERRRQVRKTSGRSVPLRCNRRGCERRHLISASTDSDGVANGAGPCRPVDPSAGRKVDQVGDVARPAMTRPATISQIENLSHITSGICQ